ncbi:hypothetical protein KC338_g185 [Hortaea werneckii]|nr:hypothetical protein KC338_g185 [Hortaea werneckii]
MVLDLLATVAASGMPLYAGPNSTSNPKSGSTCACACSWLAYALLIALMSLARQKRPQLTKYGEIRLDLSLYEPKVRMSDWSAVSIMSAFHCGISWLLAAIFVSLRGKLVQCLLFATSPFVKLPPSRSLITLEKRLSPGANTRECDLISRCVKAAFAQCHFPE